LAPVKFRIRRVPKCTTHLGRQGLRTFISLWSLLPAAGCVAIVPMFFDRAQDQLFDIRDCDVIESLNTHCLAYVIGLARLACLRVETVAACDSDVPPCGTIK
jgi:hypothetical protein